MISVHDVSMRFGSKVLFEDVTTTFSRAAATASPARTASGKSTFMKLLTGELAAAEGHGRRGPQARRAPAGPVRVRPVPRHRHGHHGQRAAVEALQERDVLYAKADADRRRRHAPRRARGHRRRGRRLLGGERRRRPAAGPRHPGRAARADDGGAAGRTEGPRAAGAGALRPSRGAAARRADEPPRPRLDPLAARVPRSATTARSSSSRTTGIS